MESICFHVITNGNPERMKSIETAFHTYGLLYKLVHFKKNPKSGKLGCFLSHIKLFKYAEKHDMDYIGIAEDNGINMYDTLPSSLSTDIKSLIPNTDWEIIILGGWFIPFTTYQNTTYPTLYKTTSIHGTTCYIIHRRLYRSILVNYKKHLHEHIDAYLANKSKCTYIASPLLFRRNNLLPTTNTYFSNTIVNYFYYINCSRTAILAWEYVSIHWLTISILVLSIILLFLIWIIYNKK